MGYRNFDTFNIEPQYEFGYGLSYTQFQISYLAAIVEKTTVRVKVKVENTGDSFSGKEVVQLYVSCPQKN